MIQILNAGLKSSEGRIVLLLLGLVFILDLGLRLVDQRLSGNLAHIERIPELVRDTGRPEERGMLVLGNSLTNNGVAQEVIAAAFADFSIGKVTPDGTALWDWQCLLDHQVVNPPEVQVDVVVIGFAWHLLSDQTRVDPSRLGGLYCRFGDLTRAGHVGLNTIGAKSEFVLASALRMYALRDTLRNRLLSTLIPHYRQFVQSANENRAGAGADRPSARYSYATLHALAERLRHKGTKVIAVAMPVQSGYALDPELQALAASGAIALLDLREVEGIDIASYLDAMHLNEQGQQTLSRKLIEGLIDELAAES